MPNILNWKKYLSEQDLYTGDILSSEMDDDFKRAIRSFESNITKHIPVAKGMVWNNNQIRTTVEDAKEAMYLLDLYKEGQATLDALGPPDQNRDGTFFDQMFISQDDANSDEWSPNKNQNQGAWQNPVPQKNDDSEENIQEKEELVEDKKQPEMAVNIDSRMMRLFNLMDTIKK